MPKIITIAREYGSGGRLIARDLSGRVSDRKSLEEDRDQ